MTTYRGTPLQRQAIALERIVELLDDLAELKLVELSVGFQLQGTPENDSILLLAGNALKAIQEGRYKRRK